MNVMVTNMPWLKHTITQSTLGKYKCQEIVHGYVVVDVLQILIMKKVGWFIE